MSEILKEYKQLSLQLTLSLDEEEIDKLTDRMDVLWGQMSNDECNEADSFYCDFGNVVAKGFEAAKKESAEHNASFDLYWKGTRALHKVYPHPEPLTQRDLGETCRMAASEVYQSRQAIQNTVELLLKSVDFGDIARDANLFEAAYTDANDAIYKALDTLRPVYPEDQDDRLTQEGPNWEAINALHELYPDERTLADVCRAAANEIRTNRGVSG